MNTKIMTTWAAATLVTSAHAVSLADASFTDWNSYTDGSLSGSAAWAGFGTVNVEFSGTPGATFISPNGTTFPRAGAGQGDLEPYSPALTAAGAVTWLTGGVNGVDTSTGTFTFSGGDFPSESVFYLTDNDVEAVLIQATLNGVSVDVSNWFTGNVQTRSGGFGAGAGWDGANATTIPSGADAEFFVQEFVPNAAFDTLTITNQNGAGGRIGFSIGNISIAVPEPSSMALLGLGSLGLLARRTRA